MSLDQPPAKKKNNVKGVSPGRKTNPCADCQLHIARCPWLRDGKPVPGWTAERILYWNPSKRRHEPSWHILFCPLRIRPDRTNEQDGTDTPYWDNLREF